MLVELLKQKIFEKIHTVSSGQTKSAVLQAGSACD